MYDEYIKFYSGKNNRFVKKPLKEALRELFNSATYKNATDGREGGKSVLIRAVFDAYRETARQMMKEKTPSLMQEIRNKKLEKIKKLRG